MSLEGEGVGRMPTELVQARKDLQQVLARRKELGILLLVDPVRAFADAGIELGAAARKYLRRRNPGFSYRNKRLYEAVKAGKIRLPWVTSVRFHFAAEDER